MEQCNINDTKSVENDNALTYGYDNAYSIVRFSFSKKYFN